MPLFDDFCFSPYDAMWTFSANACKSPPSWSRGTSETYSDVYYLLQKARSYDTMRSMTPHSIGFFPFL